MNTSVIAYSQNLSIPDLGYGNFPSDNHLPTKEEPGEEVSIEEEPSRLRCFALVNDAQEDFAEAEDDPKFDLSYFLRRIKRTKNIYGVDTETIQQLCSNTSAYERSFSR